MLFHQLLIQLSNRALRHDHAAIHDIKAVSDLQTEIQILLDQQNADLGFGAELVEWRRPISSA